MDYEGDIMYSTEDEQVDEYLVCAFPNDGIICSLRDGLHQEIAALRAENERLKKAHVTCWCENCEATEKENERLREALGYIIGVTSTWRDAHGCSLAREVAKTALKGITDDAER